MSKVKWRRRTPTYWVATIHGYEVSVKKRGPVATCPGERWYYHVMFYPTADAPWSCGYPDTLAEAKQAAEQMAQVWAGREQG